MKKKISILALILVFFVSSTSLPVALYYCNMTHTYSFNECAMDMQTQMPAGDSCRAEKISDNVSESFNNNCCTVKTIDNSIKDHYIVNHSDLTTNLNVIAFISNMNIGSGLTIAPVLNNKIILDASPPLLYSNTLYLTNSILLI